MGTTSVRINNSELATPAVEKTTTTTGDAIGTLHLVLLIFARVRRPTGKYSSVKCFGAKRKRIDVGNDESSEQ